ncbi:MAG: superoxide dismutase family protein [Candidatus Velthaea sp.]
MNGLSRVRGLAATLVLCSALVPSLVWAAKPVILESAIYDGAGHRVATARFVGVDGGTQITVISRALPPGNHGVHIHEFGSCYDTRDKGVVTAFGSAGSHYDPAGTNAHKGPDGGGHAGDLPMIQVNLDGSGMVAFFAANLHVSGPDTILGKSIIVHANSDSYTDTPPNGGSGARIACGEIGGRLSD